MLSECKGESMKKELIYLKNIYKKELILLLKNKIVWSVIFFSTFLMLLYVFNSAKNAISISESLLELSEFLETDIGDIVNSSDGESLKEIIRAISIKSCWIFPVYFFGQFIFLITAPYICFSIYSEMKGKVLKYKIIYFGKIKYIISKVLALVSLTLFFFFLESLIMFFVGILFKQNIIYNLWNYEAVIIAEKHIPFELLNYFISLVFIALILLIFSIFIGIAVYLSEVPYLGITISFITLNIIHIGKIYFPGEIISYIYNNIFDFQYFSGSTIGLNYIGDKITLWISIALWSVIITTFFAGFFKNRKNIEL